MGKILTSCLPGVAHIYAQPLLIHDPSSALLVHVLQLCHNGIIVLGPRVLPSAAEGLLLYYSGFHIPRTLG